MSVALSERERIRMHSPASKNSISNVRSAIVPALPHQLIKTVLLHAAPSVGGVDGGPVAGARRQNRRS